MRNEHGEFCTRDIFIIFLLSLVSSAYNSNYIDIDTDIRSVAVLTPVRLHWLNHCDAIFVGIVSAMVVSNMGGG